MPGPKPSKAQLQAVGAAKRTEPAPEPAQPDPPADLGDAGQRLWAGMLDDLADDLELDARELDTLAGACALEDTIAALVDAIKTDGEMLSGQHGLRLNPAVTELRQARLAKMRLLAAVELEDRSMRSPTSRRASKAAETRWDLERAKRGAA